METYAKGHLFRRGKVWWLDYFLNGARVRESSKATNKTVAERLLSQRLNSIDEGTYIHIPKAKLITFADYTERYLMIYSNGRPSWEENKRRLFVPLNHFFGSMILRDITPALIADYRARRVKDPVRIKGSKAERLIQPPTVNRELSTLSAMFNKAVVEGWLTSNPCKRLEQLKFSEAGRARQRFLNEDEINRLLAAADYPLRQILTIALFTGMRRSEIMGLKWQDIMIKDELGTITLKNTKNGVPRMVIMNRAVKQAIMSVRRDPNSDLLFPSSDPEKPWDFRKPLVRAIKSAELDAPGKEKFVFHHLRHTFCSQLGLLGYDVNSIMSLSGHKSYQMALRYTKLNTEHKVEALKRLEGKMGIPEVQPMDQENESTVTKSVTILDVERFFQEL